MIFLLIYRGAFKTRAAKIEKAAKDAGYSVSINVEKPRKGAFVVKIEGQEAPIIELLALPRPFAKLKALDMDQVVADVLAA